jgi:hypothetical protein
MASDMKNPPAWADAGRAPNSICLAAINSEVTEKALHLQEIRAVWISRLSRLPLSVAAALAPLAFGTEVRT